MPAEFGPDRSINGRGDVEQTNGWTDKSKLQNDLYSRPYFDVFFIFVNEYMCEKMSRMVHRRIG